MGIRMRMFYKSKTQNGFTIIELMIIVAMISVLAAVAIPSYENYIQKSYAKAAATVLQKDAQFMEKYQAICGNYGKDTTSVANPQCASGSVTASNLAWPTLPYKVAPETGESQYYISFSSSKPAAAESVTSYRLRATPICGSAAARHNDCTCVNWNSPTSPTGGNTLCYICLDYDGNIVYDTSYSCSN
jgi:prepilin-type N-terminal cleavage/methylation domain-containing protein